MEILVAHMLRELSKNKEFLQMPLIQMMRLGYNKKIEWREPKWNKKH